MSSSTKDAVARRVTERRIELRLSQEDLALRLGIKQSNVSVAECNGISTLAAIGRWAEALDCNPIWLAYGTGAPDKDKP